MGATWFSKDHSHLLNLLSELNLPHFEQHTEGIALFETSQKEKPQTYKVPPNTHSAYRVKGGTHSVVQSLIKQIGLDGISLNTQITDLTDLGNCIKVTDTQNNEYFGTHIVFAVPPLLVIHSTKFEPPLPQNLSNIMKQTQTWMSGSIKFSVEYKQPFWRENGFSGSVFSQIGLATEIYDHCNFEESRFALKGFLGDSANHLSFLDRKNQVTSQLANCFGLAALQLESYHDKIWTDQHIQPKSEVFLPPHFNNGNILFDASYMDDKLHFATTETNKYFGGYMEGAIRSAGATAKKIATQLLA